MLGAAAVGRNEGQIDLGLRQLRKLDLGLLGRLAQTLQCLAILAQVNALLLAELIGQPAHNALVPVVTTQVRVAIGGLDFDDAITHFEHGDVEGAAAQVKDENCLVVLLVEAIGHGRGRGLVDDAQHLKAGNLPGILGGLALAVVKVSRHSDDRLAHFLAQIGLGVALELAQDHCADFLRRIDFVLVRNRDACVVVRPFRNLIGDHAHGLLRFGVVKTATHEALDRVDGVLGVDNSLALGCDAHKALAILGKGNNRRRGAIALGVWDNSGSATFHHSHHAIGGAQVNTNNLSHEVKSSNSNAIELQLV